MSEADAAERRRLVNAFLHGPAGALDLEPSREGRAVVAGLLLAGLLTGGCALVRVATSEPPDTRPIPPAGRTADESAGSRGPGPSRK